MAGRREDHRVTKRTMRHQVQMASVQNPDTEIWSSILDGRYIVAVYHLGQHRGQMTIRDGGEFIYQREVGLPYEPHLGPEVVDVGARQDIATTVVNEFKPKKLGKWQWTYGTDRVKPPSPPRRTIAY